MTAGRGDEVEDAIAGIVAEVAEIPREAITPEGSLTELGVDSLLNIEIAVHIEQRFGVHFDEEDLGGISTFGQIVALTRSKLPASTVS